MDPTLVSDPRLGTILQGRYRLLQRLAAGGMGVVYRGERLEVGRPVAIKFLHPWIAAEPSFQRRFQLEAQAMSRLSHPCCVSLIDFGVEGDSPFMVMDFVTGRTLGSLVREGGPLPVKRALGLVRQVLAGLAHAHAQGIVHRDIKPDNIVLTEAIGLGEQVRILDFGLARLRDTVTGLTAGLIVGTPAYMAPEQISTGEVDARTDLYSVGVLLFELLTGTKPFHAEQSAELMRQHQQATPPTLGSTTPGGGFSQELERVVGKALAKHPGDRFQSAADFAAALDALPQMAATPAPGFDTSVPRPEAPSTQSLLREMNRFTGRRRWVAASAAGLVLLGLGAALLWPTKQGAVPASNMRPPVTRDTSAPKPQQPTAVEEVEDSAGEQTPPREELPGIEQIERWVKEGERRRDQSLRALAKLRAQYPASAYAPYLEGHVNFDNLRWMDGLASYGAAIRNDSAYRSDPKLIRNVIRCLVSDRFHAKCGEFLVREVGAPAAPFLEEAARSASYANVQSRAARLLPKVTARR
ncbi:serine/threonine-protein kinase [Archangium lipolyticum]|uniref:serine/threonine-protein kinase n=1 Tax=Archangium lipolyticum TaxID=2970465 RepID=UPI002149A51C|nr:serine/threonine-protein kinase [Archangium lipolyticum]